AENHTQKERMEFLKKEYGTGGRSWTFQDGSSGFLDYDAKGGKVREYVGNHEPLLKWPEVEKRIHVLIAMGQYLDGTEQQAQASYKLLGRLKADCEYFLGAGQRNEKHLWAGSVRAQIDKMEALYEALSEKPEWLTSEMIDNYRERMAPHYQVIVYHQTEGG